MEEEIKYDAPDMELIHGYLAGNASCFDVLYCRYRRQLYAYLNELLSGNRSSVDDVFQQTWLKAIDNMSKYQDRQLFLAWLMRIAHNLAIDSCRKNQRMAQYQIEPAADDGTAPEIPDRRYAPGRDMEQKELSDAIDHAIETLSPELREVFLLRMEDVPFKEIAEIQQCSINTVLARMQYAMKNLRKLLRDWSGETAEPPSKGGVK